MMNGMDIELNQDQVMMRDSVRRVMDDIATPEYIRRLDASERYPSELYAAWAELGLFGVPFSQDQGGMGGSATDLVMIAHEISRKSADFYMAFAASIFCGMNIARKGTPEQQARWLPRLMSGEIKMSVSISEPEAGSDASAIRTTARRDGGHYVLNGQKLWATGAGADGNIINVYARTNPEASPRKGLSLFLVDNKTPGVELRKLQMLGRRCTGTYEIFLNDVRVPADTLVGGENQGWDCMLSGLRVERLMAAAGNVGASRACFELALGYARERRQFGRAIGTNQSLSHLLADLETQIEAADSLVWRAARILEAGGDALREITMAKLMSSETYVAVANAGMQVFGAYGYSMEYDMQRHYREARSTTIAAGTSQMQRDILAGMLGLRAS